MSERYKGKFYYQTEWGTTVALTCHFKFQWASHAQRYDKNAADGCRPVCNGCGPSGYGALVPDTILGVGVTICGDLHNWGYAWGKDREDKMVIDETFGDNMDRLIRDHYENECRKIKGGSLVSIRLWLAKRKFKSQLTMAEDAYEKAVKVFGHSAFWDKRPIRFSLDDIKEAQ